MEIKSKLLLSLFVASFATQLSASNIDVIEDEFKPSLKKAEVVVKRTREDVAEENMNLQLAGQAIDIALEAERREIEALQSSQKKSKDLHISFKDQADVFPFVNPITRDNITEEKIHYNKYLKGWAFDYCYPIVETSETQTPMLVEKVKPSIKVPLEVKDRFGENVLIYKKRTPRKKSDAVINYKLNQFKIFKDNYYRHHKSNYRGSFEMWSADQYSQQADKLYKELCDKKEHDIRKVGVLNLKAAHELSKHSGININEALMAKQLHLLKNAFHCFFETAKRSNMSFHKSMDGGLRVIKRYIELKKFYEAKECLVRLDGLFSQRKQQIEGAILDRQLHVMTEGMSSQSHNKDDCYSCNSMQENFTEYHRLVNEGLYNK